jgi:sigma-B regulation protein RsbU (phosphoserine phosphatase)
MERESIRILLVEDSPGDARLLRELLREDAASRVELTHVERLSEARARVSEIGPDVVLLDLSLPDAHGMETVRQMLDAAPDVPIIVLTGLDDERTAMAAMQAGAQDYLVKGAVDGRLVLRAVRYARERKRLERERARLLERERDARGTAEGAVRARDEVLRVVSHDLGNSLTAVLVTTRVLLKTLEERDVEDPVRRGILNIRELAEQMQRLRQDLLDVAMIEAGRLSMEPKPLEPAELIRVTHDRYGALAAEKSLDLGDGGGEAVPLVLGDAARLLQVLANLVTNAIKFTPAGGSILLGAERAGEDVRFFVADTGPGIPENDMPRLFDRFWTTRAGNPHGAGLGLAIARGIVEAHGGRLHVHSVPGEGTRFSFTIPLADV